MQLVPEDVQMMWSPFLGGGSVELACAARGIRVFGSDLFEPLVNFWNHLLDDAAQLLMPLRTTYLYLKIASTNFRKPIPECLILWNAPPCSSS